ncbi:uncharacterized protein LOC124812001 [Hydra vulgaris]|uniref:uncharacterized protein LOC124812001 n=1 Tax=Hydra vulgaris TaxID=6087 RepID=UPI0032E9CAF6
MDGPEFLYQDLSYWPSEPSDIFNKSKTDEISNLSVVVNVNPTKFSTENSEVKEALETNSLNMRNVINVEQFSSLHKLFKVTAYVLKFIISLKHLINKANNQTKSLCIADIRKAEILWIRTYQCDLSNKVEILNNTFGLFVDEDKVVRCKGRLQNSILPYNAKHPILLPSESYLSELLIFQAHKRTLHAGVKETLCQIRSKYWILRGRKLVRSLINKCSFCKRLFGKAFTSKVSPPLPYYRVTASFPFQHTGVDYLGPLHVKPIFDDNSTEMYPVHVVLFTCATTRAIHLDLVPDLSAKSFILCLNLIISDNATCFKNEEVKLSEELLLLGIDWKYIIEAAPWWGGFWERLVQSVKKPLLKVVFRSSIRYDELETILCEIEGLLNSRPITYAYHEDTEEVLTPSHLMHGRRLISPNETKGADLDKLESKIQLTKRMKYLKLIRDHFWRPIEKLYPIEVKSVETVTDTELNASNDAVDESNDFSDTKYERPHIHTAESEVEKPPLPSLPLWEPPKLLDSDSNFLSVSASMDQIDDLPVTQIVFPSEMQSVSQVQPLLHSSSSFSLPSQKTGIDQINNFIRKANVEPNTVEGIQFIVKSVYRKLCGLETEMRSMRSILDTNHGNKENINIDYLPANSVKEFDSLENKIINSNDKDIICRKLKQIGGRNVSDFLKNALKTCLTDKLCCSINRTGADKSVNL